ncbi:MAG: sensor histidine kinase, partial [Bdellovibrionales bacterium]
EEFDYLARAFNRMTQQIEEQQKALLEANRQMDRRRRFTETVLAGATSGIIGVDANGLITLANNSASKLLGIENDALSAMRVSDIAEELGALLESAHERADKITQADIQIKNQDDDARRVFLVRIAIELVGDRDVGAIITFDDITDLQSAQRKAAWADVARRIAHEIKNPLTPIQLSAERLKRKYLTEIQTTPEVFSECTDTIIRHVEDIERMVNEFSSFARMPEPTMKRENLAALVRETLSLHIHAHPDIDFNISGGEDAGAFFALCDAQQIRQALNNLVQNAVDSIHARMEATDEKGRVDVLLTTSDAAHAAIVVSDNGLGLPKEEAASRLTEPYVTHKVKGTGLGLAIVKKIMEDHGGDIVLGVSEGLENNPQWRDLGGASVSLVIPLIVSLEQPVIQGCAA